MKKATITYEYIVLEHAATAWSPYTQRIPINAIEIFKVSSEVHVNNK